MKIFKGKNNKLEFINQVNFTLEKEIQRLVEDNLEDLFNLEFLESEHSTSNREFRFDTVAFDTENESFVIIEYKKDKNSSVIDQGMTYLNILNDSKSDLVLIYNNKHKCNKEISDFDWKLSKVIFISQNFNNFNIHAINNNLPIELWEIKKYANDLISLNPITTKYKGQFIDFDYNKNESKKRNKIETEFVNIDLDYHLDGATDIARNAFEKLREQIFSIDDSIEEVPKKLYIAYKINNKNFVDVIFWTQKTKDKLLITINLKEGELSDLDKKARCFPVKENGKREGHWGNGDYEFELADENDIYYAIGLIKQSFDKKMKK